MQMTNSLLFHRMNFPDELSKLGCMHGCGPCGNAKSQIKTVPKVAFMNVVLSPGSFITCGMCAQIFKTNCLFFWIIGYGMAVRKWLWRAMQCETLHSGSRDFTNRFSRKHGAPLELGILLPTSRTDREPRKLLLTESRFSWDPATNQEAQTLQCWTCFHLAVRQEELPRSLYISDKKHF